MATYSLQALHDEIEADPEALGYKEIGGEWKGDQVVADLINAKSYKVDLPSVLSTEIRALATYEAYNTLLVDEQEWLQWMTAVEEVRVTADVKLQLSGRTMASNGAAGTGINDDSFWAAAHADEMAPAMLALLEVDGSRAEVLWGQGRTITISDVAYTANL